MFGHRFNRSEHDIPYRLSYAAVMFLRTNDTTGGAIFQRPCLKFFGNLFGYKNHMKASNMMQDIVEVNKFVKQLLHDIEFRLPNMHLNYSTCISHLNHMFSKF